MYSIIADQYKGQALGIRTFIINESLIRKKIIKRNLEFYDRRVPKRKAKAQETAEQWQARLNRESERKRAQESEKNV
ncbi:uncharacterized protein OCT59_001349 [Rhizophagus irregularis]|uniref:uncharacterized protein n=1 Tax=Rhizophagus irregularis TaxID=588596 RepID=UPI00332AA776|nr:hypothetical protein OCT59_001349 [Rhizophagus irregularis]